MDLSRLLTGAKHEFLRCFEQASQAVLARSIDDFFVRADDSFSSLDQGRYLDARAILTENSALFLSKMHENMAHLVSRSLETTYSTYRPSAHFSTENLTLIDANAFEGGLRLEEITASFRNAAEEGLRDLNIRIAVMFDQEFTSERENPFRPYLFSRCLSISVEQLQINPNLQELLVDRLAYNLLGQVSVIYGGVNSYFAENGIEATLQFKIKKAPDANPSSASSPTSQHGGGTPGSRPQMPGSGAATHANTSSQSQESFTPQDRRTQIEQFFSTALSRAMNMMGGGQSGPRSGTDGGPSGSSMGGGGAGSGVGNAQSGGPSGAQNREGGGFPQLQFGAGEGQQGQQGEQGSFNWLKNGEAISEALRKFFTSTMQTQNGNLHQGTGQAAEPSAEMPEGEEGGHLASGSAEHAANGVFDPDRRIGDPNSLPSILRQFQISRTPSSAEMLDATGSLRNLILEQHAELSPHVNSVDEQMTIDIVAMLFEFILRDPQVPAEIRAQLGRLQFLVLKLALKDRSFLTEKSHPARVLVNRIGSVSIGLQHDNPSAEIIAKEICRIVEVLLEDETEDSTIFSRVLHEFDVFISHELRAIGTQTEDAIEGAEQIRNRMLRFAHTAAQLHDALQGLTIDPFLQHFFENAWVHVLDLADRQDEKRALRYRLLVPDLLWSIIPKVRTEDRAQLISLLPVILSTLKEGMDSIEYDSAKQEVLMNWLVAAHTKVMRSQSKKPTKEKLPSLAVIHQHFTKFFADPDLQDYAALDEQSSSQARHFVDDAVKDLAIKVQVLDAVADHELPSDDQDAPIPIVVDGCVDPVVEQLKIGVSVEINLGGEPKQGQLNWIDPALTNLILSLDGQELPTMVSVRMFRRMIAHGRVKFLETEPLFERAVQSLLKSADGFGAARN